MRSWHYNLGLAGTLLALACVSPIASADDEEHALRMAKIRSAFLLNFAKYTTWPDGAFAEDDSPLVITVFGEGEIVSVLKGTVAGVKVRDRRIVVRHATPPDRKGFESDEAYERARAEMHERLRRSHVVFCSRAAACAPDEVAARLSAHPVLLVGDNEQCVRDGAALGIAEVSGRMRIFANRSAVERSRVKVSSKLLKLAVQVDEEE